MWAGFRACRARLGVRELAEEMDLFRLVNRFNIRENLAAVKKAGAGAAENDSPQRTQRSQREIGCRVRWLAGCLCGRKYDAQFLIERWSSVVAGQSVRASGIESQCTTAARRERGVGCIRYCFADEDKVKSAVEMVLH